MSRLGNIVSYIFSIVFLTALAGGCGYMVYDMVTHKPKKQAPYDACAQMTFYNKADSELMQLYTQARVNKDTLLSFVDENGNEQKASKFVGIAKMDNYIADITLIGSGLHYKVEVIASGMCKSDKKMDSIKAHQDDEDGN